MYVVIFIFGCLFFSFVTISYQIHSGLSIGYDFYKLLSSDDMILGNNTNISSDCLQYLNLLPAALKNQEMWPIQMLDASSKFQSGLLEGNYMDLGAFDECVKIYDLTSLGIIKGKYCLSKLSLNIQKLEKYSNNSLNKKQNINNVKNGVTLSFAVCVPHICTTEDVRALFRLIKFDVVVEEDTCQTIETTNPELDNGAIIVLCFLGILLFIVLASTALDITKRQKETKASLMNAFSIVRNGKKILDTTSFLNEISCLSGIRAIATIGVVYYHVYMDLLIYPARNIVDIISERESYHRIIIVNANVGVDTFFLISGMMVSYGSLLDSKHGYKLHIPTFYLHRLLRLTPNLLVVVLIWTFLLYYMSFGPIWHGTNGAITNCKEYWWTTLLYVHNYVNSSTMCVPHTWYLAVDMQLYILSPILIITLLKWPKISLIFTSLLTIGSIAAGFLVTWIGLDPETLASSKKYQFQNYYFATHTRASSWFMGFIFGYIIFISQGKERILLNTKTRIIGWLLCILIFGFDLIPKYADFKDEPNGIRNCFENALRRPAWTLALGWIVYNCHFGYGGILNSFFSLPIFKIMSKLTYASYLLHYTFNIISKSSMRTTTYSTYLRTMYEFIGTYILTQIAAIILLLAVEYPMLTIEKLCIRKRKK